MPSPPSPPCTRCASPLEASDLRCAICGQVTAERAPVENAVRVQLLRCKGCAAAVSFDAKAQGLACAFCGEVLRLETIDDPPEEIEGWLPFTVDRDAARRALRRWQSSLGFFHPADLTARAKVEEVRPLWWVGWVFDARARISWTADSNEDSRRSYWAPHAGQTDMVFDDLLVSASRGLLEVETAALAAGYDLSTVRAAPEGVEEAIHERFDVRRSLARRLITDAIRRVAAGLVEKRRVPGSRVRKLKVVPLLRALETRRYAFPAWVMTYRYRDECYRAVVSGQDAAFVHGRAPLSTAKILLVGAAGVVLLLVLGAVLVGGLAR